MFKNLRLNEFSRVMGLMGKNIHQYLILLFISCLALSSFEIIYSLETKDLIDAAVNKEINILVKAVIIIIAVFIVTNVIVDPIVRYIIRKNIRKTILTIRMQVILNLEKQAMVYFDTNLSGDIMSKVNDDLNRLEEVYDNRMHQVLMTAIQGSAATITLFILNYKLALISVLIGIVSTIVNIKFAVPTRIISDQVQKHKGNMTQDFLNLITGIRIVKVFKIEDVLLKKYLLSTDEVATKNMQLNILNSIISGVNFLLTYINVAGVVCVGAFMLRSGTVTIGTIGAIIALQTSSNNLFMRLGGFFVGLQSSLAGAARIFEIIDHKTEESEFIFTPSVGKNMLNSKIVFKNVCFSYQEDKPTLEDINLTMTQENIIALVGPSGSGKSTIFNLLMGFYKIKSGEIYIDGQKIENFQLEELRNKISYVPQDAYLFNDTIYENIKYGNFKATSDEVIAASKAAFSHYFIEKLTDGYDTIVGEKGVLISGGQKQRISIARAFLKESAIVLLDEATSAVDSESEQLIHKAFEKLISGRTVIVIAHRLSTVEKADKIYVIKDGRIVEEGNHKDLLVKKSEYYNLYKMQFSNE